MVGLTIFASHPRLTTALRWLIQITLAVVVVIFVAQYLGDQWEQVRDDPPEVDWGILLVAQIGLTIGFSTLPLGSQVILRALDTKLSSVTIWRVFFLSNIAKYLPGSVWALPSRAFLYQRAGVSTGRSVVAVFWEVLLMIFGAGTLSIFAYRLVDDTIPSALFILLVIIFTLGMIIGLTMLYSPRFQSLLARLPLPKVVNRLMENRALWLSPRQLVQATLSYWLAWILIGASFAGMVYAVNPDFEARLWLELPALYAGAWLVGFLVIIAPGGIGVRDALLTIGLSVFLNDPLPAVIAVIARIAWTLAEVTGVLLVSVIFAMHTKRG